MTVFGSVIFVWVLLIRSFPHIRPHNPRQVFTTAFFLSLSVASYYLGWPVLLVILAANLLTLAAHVPAIRDRRLPPPQDLRQGLAFHSRLMTHKIITTARAWSFASILLVLVLILVMRTVPANYKTGDGSNGGGSALYQRRRPRRPLPPPPAAATAGGLDGLGSNGTAPQQDRPAASVVLIAIRPA